MTSQTSAATAEAEERAGEVRDTVQEQAGRVAGTAAEQTREVAHDTLERARDLGGELRSTVGREMQRQQDRLAEAVRGFASELDSMASGSGQSGPASQAASVVAEQVSRVADSLDGTSGTDLADTLRSFARSRPVTFLASAALAGVVVGRFVRGVQAGRPTSASGPTSSGLIHSPAVGSSSARPTTSYGNPGYSSADAGTGAGVGYLEEDLPASDRPLGEVRLVESDTVYESEGRS